MKIFQYFARDSQGRARKGEIESPDEKGAVLTLRSNALYPIRITEKAAEGAIMKRLKNFHLFGGNDVVIFTRQLSTMVAAGLPLTAALDILQEQTQSSSLKEGLTTIVRDIEGGSSFGAALERHPRLFSPVYISLVRAGEAAGVLDNVLVRLADNLEKDREFKAKTRGALVYPTIVVIAMVIVTAIMMIFVIPKLTGLYTELGTSLPLPTRIIIAVSEITVHWWWLVLIVLFAGITGVRRWSLTPAGNRAVDRFILKIPVWGSIQLHVVLSELIRTLALLIGAGLPIIEALQISSKAAGNALYADAIVSAAKQVERGYALSQPLASDPLFPPIVYQMVRTGESTGKLDEILMKLAAYFEGEAEHEIKGLTVAIEPIIMIVLGVGVAFLVMSIILPIYKLTSSF